MRKLFLEAGVLMAVVVLAAPAAPAADWDVKLDVDKATTDLMAVDTNASKGRDFINHVAVYIRIVPHDNQVNFPVFIDKQNYLICPDSDKRYLVKNVYTVHKHRRTGMKLLGFFFDKPECDEPLFHMRAVVGDPEKDLKDGKSGEA